MKRLSRLLIFLALTTACTGALAGGTLNLGREDKRTAGAKLYDAHCGGCHDPKAGAGEWHAKTKIAPALANVVAPDLLSSAWRESLVNGPYGGDGDQHPPDMSLAEWRAALMHTIFSHVCWYGRERWPNGDRIDYRRVGQTIDGLPIFRAFGHERETPVVVMPPCRIGDADLNAIRDWITCAQYPGTSFCVRTR